MNEETETNTVSQPIQMIHCSIAKEKMEAIKSLAESNLEIAKALNGVHAVAEITNCNFTNMQGAAVEIIQP
jgi:hypothetical protein